MRTAQKKVEGLTAAATLLKSLGVPDDVIVKALALDTGLIPLLGGPLARLKVP